MLKFYATTPHYHTLNQTAPLINWNKRLVKQLWLTDIPKHKYSVPEHLDIVGSHSLVKYNNDTYHYLLICNDRTTKWIETEPLAEITARTVARAFVNVWITRWGVPIHVITDCGRQFENKLF